MNWQTVTKLEGQEQGDQEMYAALSAFYVNAQVYGSRALTDRVGDSVIHRLEIDESYTFATLTTSHEDVFFTLPSVLPRLSPLIRVLRPIRGTKYVSHIDEPNTSASVHMLPVLNAASLLRIIENKSKYPERPLAVLVFAEGVISLDFVDAVVCERRPTHLRIWTVVNHASESQRFSIYRHERDVLQKFPRTLIEFNLIDRYDEPIAEIAEWSQSALIIAKQDA